MGQTMQLNQFAQTPILGNTATKVNLNTLPVTIDPNSVATLLPGDAVYMTATTSNQIYVDKWSSGIGPIFGYILYNVKGATSGVTVNNNGFTANNQVEIGLGGTIMFGQAATTITRGQFLEYTPSASLTTGPQMTPTGGINPVSAIALDNAASQAIFRFMVLDIAEVNQNSIFVLAAYAAGNNSINPAITGETITLSATTSATFNATSVLPNKGLYFIIVASSLTQNATFAFGTNFRSAGTIAAATTTGKIVTISFRGDGTNYDEISRITNGGAGI